jgi:hypothetical protein
MGEQYISKTKPLIDKYETKKLKGPICPYCLSHIERLSFVTEKGEEPQYRYMFCEECNAFLAMIPVESGEMDVEALKTIIKS